jgi:hypothetical protein
MRSSQHDRDAAPGLIICNDRYEAGATAVNFRLPQTGTRYVCPQAVFKLQPGFDALLRGIAIDLEVEAVGASLAFPSVPRRRRSRTGA